MVAPVTGAGRGSEDTVPMLRLVVALGMVAGCADLIGEGAVGISCQGDSCTCGPDSGSCSHECTAGESCSIVCEDSSCALDCNGASTCNASIRSTSTAQVNCAGGACSVACLDFAHCTVTECVAPDCKVVCRGQAVVVTSPMVSCP